MHAGKRISTREATVKTATVEIKALTVGGKQVTLAVFRQLLNEDLLDGETGQLRGVPWGLINYFWGQCEADDHLHVVWQSGEELRRACLQQWRPYWARNLEQEAMKLLVTEARSLAKVVVYHEAVAHRRGLTDCGFEYDAKERAVRVPAGPHYWLVRLDGESGETALSRFWLYDEQKAREPRPTMRAGRRAEETPEEVEARVAAEKQQHQKALAWELTRALRELRQPDVVSCEQVQEFHARLVEVTAAYSGQAQRQDAADAAWEANYKAIQALDQLFIAV